MPQIVEVPKGSTAVEALGPEERVALRKKYRDLLLGAPVIVTDQETKAECLGFIEDVDEVHNVNGAVTPYCSILMAEPYSSGWSRRPRRGIPMGVGPGTWRYSRWANLVEDVQNLRTEISLYRKNIK